MRVRFALAIGFFIPYWLWLESQGCLHGDVIVVGCIVIASTLLSAGAWGDRIFPWTLPFAATMVAYDSQRFIEDRLRGPIHVKEPYFFDKIYFGIRSGSNVLTPNEWWQAHTFPVLDLITGFMYLTFLLIYVFFAAYFNFYVARKGTAKCDAAFISKCAPGMGWGFLWLNLLGYSTYYWYAAAPPWYVARYGLNPARLDVPASAAGCARFDQLLGTHLFSGMYGLSTDVFGSVPSLHVAYPLLAMIFAFRFGAARVATTAYFVLMVFSAIYLNHHYVLDVLWGCAYALLIGWAMLVFYERQPGWASNVA